MNDADKKLVIIALRPIVNIEAPLSNLKNRGPRAVKYWKEEIPKQKKDKKIHDILKQATAEMDKLLKLVAKSEKDIAKITKLAMPKNLALFPSKEVFRIKVSPLLKSITATEHAASKLKVGLSAKTGIETMFVGSKNIDVKASIQAIEALANYANALRIGFARL